MARGVSEPSQQSSVVPVNQERHLCPSYWEVPKVHVSAILTGL